MSATLTLTRTRFGIGIGPWIDNRAEAADEAVARFHCRFAMLWPQWVAALVKPDLWISLRQE